MHAYPSQVPGLTTWVASLPAADSAACWAAIDALAHQMAGDDPTRTLEQCRADALVDLMLTNVEVTTTVTLMIPVQTATVDEPDDALERDLIVRHANNPEPTTPARRRQRPDRQAKPAQVGVPLPEPAGRHRRLRPTHPRPQPDDRADLDADRRDGLRDPRHRGDRRRHRRRDPGQVRHPHRPGPARRTHRGGHRDQPRHLPAQPGHAPVHPKTRRPLPLPRLRPQRQTLRTRPRHPLLPRRTHRHPGTWPASANTTTGSNTKPAGP